MAGYDHTISRQRPWHYTEIVAWTILAVFFILCFAGPAQAFYLISSQQEKIQTECYFILGSKVHLCNGREILLSDVISIDESGMTEQEITIQQVEKEKFFGEVESLLKTEKQLTENFNNAAILMDAVIAKKISGDKTLKSDTKKVLGDIKTLNSEFKKLHKKWLEIRIPTKNLVILREIKILELDSVHSTCRDWKEYIDDWSPTIREYAKEHVRQKAIFEASFNSHLKELKNKNVPPDEILK
jgi:hypothetical protein